MFKYLLLAVLFVSVSQAVSDKDAENYVSCIKDIDESCSKDVDFKDYDDCDDYAKMIEGDDEEIKDISGAEYFGAYKDCYQAIADDMSGDCKKYYEALVDCSGSVVGFVFALFGLAALLI
ncbi:hypothetical protein PPERSA_10552 [Pseudocohnilembus persalinus]|uniref:Uncharacterized protein n=1 Tax=Pseudocohnilembus persalinus TaxID=266149 RepID=A0A0V0QLQ3_PSEPJ|nr:hypothetical protein PPERSA_10552 [Pseudocohnilembus persalinus]|eukprot:KRX03179.1 hypothetical protein PPERSA_10552 [Pseudocohnilembus persalinus]